MQPWVDDVFDVGGSQQTSKDTEKKRERDKQALFYHVFVFHIFGRPFGRGGVGEAGLREKQMETPVPAHPRKGAVAQLYFVTKEMEG